MLLDFVHLNREPGVVNTTLAKESIPCVPKKETSTGSSTGKLLYIVMVST
uniref:Uncharacterized protein n=1 Tax=Setaria viridis TaxID=4556 RepID=A0A4U6SV35_SETVI|nr:hypothetical protein SEVIR_9G142300v2 [Setaria viridis]